MSSAADLILAASDDIPAIVASDYPLGTFKGVNIDGLDPLKLAALHSLLVHRAFGEVLRDYRPLAQASPKGPWLIKLPDELITFLGKIAPPDQASVAASWASTGEVQEEGWSQENADQFLARLVPLAQTASFEGRNLFLWIYN
ncbi:MAG TPA: hypothetical protein VJK02_20470 [Anaerolineales bacterium]|nr:hypothetical protein [Anaerolineales bacterium]